MESLIAWARDHYLLIAGVISVAVGLRLLRKFFAGGVCHSDVRLDGKTVIVTGGNTGIGLETARDMARRGARVILGCRDATRGENAAKDVRKTTGNGNVEFRQLDLSSLQSVRNFAAEILKTEKQIHILINNAGIMMCPQWESKEGYELQFATNHLGHFLLTNLLLPKIKSSAPSRIVNLSSRGHQLVKTINFDDINFRKNYHPRFVYAQSKMANILFSKELARRIKGSGVVVNAVHPGAVNTELMRNLADAGYPMWLINLLFPVAVFFFKTPSQGAQTSIHCAVSEEVSDVTGKYFSDCAEKAPTLPKDEEAVSRRLWEVSEDMVGQKFL